MRAFKAIPLLTVWLALPAMASDHKEPPVQPATSFAAVEVHDKEKVAIAAEPYDTKEKESIFRVDYLSHGVMPIRLIVTNQRRPAHLSARRAHSLPDRRRRPHSGRRARGRGAADDPQGARGRQNSHARPASRHPPKPKASNKEIEADFDQFEYGALVVEPHTTRAGFLFYDVSRARPPAQGRQAAPARTARRRRQRAFLLRDSVRQISAVEVQRDEVRFARMCGSSYS